MSIWVVWEVLRYVYGDRVKKWIKFKIDLIEAERIHKRNQDLNRIKELKRSEVLEVVAEDVGTIEWSVLYNENRTKYKVLDITEENA
jgi:hypothetical protein